MEGNDILDLYRCATQNVKDADWPERYKDFCDKVRAVKNWENLVDAPDDLVKEVISTSKNGIASMGWAWNRWLKEVDTEKARDKYRKLLNHIKDGLGKASPAVELYKCRQEFDGIIGRNDFDSFFNRIVAAFLPGKVSPVVTEAPFGEACRISEWRESMSFLTYVIKRTEKLGFFTYMDDDTVTALHVISFLGYIFNFLYAMTILFAIYAIINHILKRKNSSIGVTVCFVIWFIFNFLVVFEFNRSLAENDMLRITGWSVLAIVCCIASSVLCIFLFRNIIHFFKINTFTI